MIHCLTTVGIKEDRLVIADLLFPRSKTESGPWGEGFSMLSLLVCSIPQGAIGGYSWLVTAETSKVKFFRDEDLVP